MKRVEMSDPEQLQQKQEENVVNGHNEDEEAQGQVMPVTMRCFKHPLRDRWTLWYFKMDRNRDWCDNNKVVTTFETVEDFWGLYDHIMRASKLASGCDYSMFKENIQPMWEDKQNKQGGRWLINMNRNQRQSDLDNVWLEMLLCLIGDAFNPHSDQICGAVVNIRQKGDKLGLWTRDCRNEAAILHVGGTLRDRLNMPKTCLIGYQAHTDTSTKTGSMVKNRFEI